MAVISVPARDDFSRYFQMGMNLAQMRRSMKEREEDKKRQAALDKAAAEAQKALQEHREKTYQFGVEKHRYAIQQDKENKAAALRAESRALDAQILALKKHMDDLDHRSETERVAAAHLRISQAQEARAAQEARVKGERESVAFMSSRRDALANRASNLAKMIQTNIDMSAVPGQGLPPAVTENNNQMQDALVALNEQIGVLDAQLHEYNRLKANPNATPLYADELAKLAQRYTRAYNQTFTRDTSKDIDRTIKLIEAMGQRDFIIGLHKAVGGSDTPEAKAITKKLGRFIESGLPTPKEGPTPTITFPPEAIESTFVESYPPGYGVSDEVLNETARRLLSGEPVDKGHLQKIQRLYPVKMQQIMERMSRGE